MIDESTPPDRRMPKGSLGKSFIIDSFRALVSAQGPYLICTDEYGTSPRSEIINGTVTFMDSELEEMRANIDFEEQTVCQRVGYKALLVKPFYLEGGGSDSMILLLASTFIFIGAGNWLISSTTFPALFFKSFDIHTSPRTSLTGRFYVPLIACK